MDEQIMMIANDYLTGLSLRELASKYHYSHVTIKNFLEKKLPEIDGILAQKVKSYAELKKLKDDKSILNPQIVERIRKVYKLLVEENKTVKEIAQLLSSTEFTIYRDLTTRLPLLVEKFPNEFPKSMLLNVKTVISAHRSQNGPGNRNLVSFTALNLKTSKQILFFLVHSMLSFRLTFKTASELFGLDEETLIQNINDNYPFLNNSFTYLNDYEKPNQVTCRTNFLTYYSSLLEAKKTDHQEFLTLFEQITDKKYLEVIKKRKNGEKNKVGDGKIIAEYQLKYSLPDEVMAYILDISVQNYVLLTKKYRDSEAERRHENLMAAWNSGFPGKGGR